MRNHAIARLKHVDLQNAGQMILNFCSSKDTGILKFRKDSPDGPVIATVPIKAIDKWRREFVDFAPQAGIHDIYLTYENPTFPVEHG